MCDRAVERLFSLFTSADRAEALAGDLTEERDAQGWFWYLLQVASVVFALWRNATTEAPLRVLALVLVGVVFLSASTFGGVAAVLLFPARMDSQVGWIALPCVWWSGAFFTGVSLVALAPLHGMAACATLAIAGGALLVAIGGPALWREPLNTDLVLVCTIGLLTAMPLLAGAAAARRRLTAIPVLPPKQDR